MKFKLIIIIKSKLVCLLNPQLTHRYNNLIMHAIINSSKSRNRLPDSYAQESTFCYSIPTFSSSSNTSFNIGSSNDINYSCMDVRKTADGILMDCYQSINSQNSSRNSSRNSGASPNFLPETAVGSSNHSIGIKSKYIEDDWVVLSFQIKGIFQSSFKQVLSTLAGSRYFSSFYKCQQPVKESAHSSRGFSRIYSSYSNISIRAGNQLKNPLPSPGRFLEFLPATYRFP